MAKKNVVIFDGEDKFINPKKAVYSKSKGQAKKVESFKSLRAALMDEEGQGPVELANDNVSNNQTSVGGGSYDYNAPIEVASPYNIQNAPINEVAPPIPILSDIPAPPVNLPSLGEILGGGGSSLDRPSASMDYQEERRITTPSFSDSANPPSVDARLFAPITQETYVAPVPPLPTPAPVYVAPPPVYEEEPRRKTMPIEDIATPISTSTLFNDGVLKPIGTEEPIYARDMIDCVKFPWQCAPTPELPVYNPTQDYTRLPVFGNDGNSPSVDARSPVSGIGLTFGQNATTAKTCPAGMRDYFGTCIPITNQYAACQQGYMKEYEGGPCVPIPASGALGGCAAGYEYKMGYRSGSLTPEMGCYPIGSYQDINTGGSTGAILGGGSGSNIGGGGTVQGGGGSYGDSGNPSTNPNKNYNCPEYTVYDPVSGTCRAAYENAVVPCPAGFRLNEATGTCIESTNPQDYKCPPINLPTPPKCKKYAVVGKDTFGCDRYELVDDAANCPEVIQEKPIECQDGLIYSEALKKCVNPIDETKKPALTTPEGTCPEGFEFNVQQQKCISKCPTGKTFDPVNKICVDPTIYTPAKPYCSANMEWDEAQQKCVFTGTITKSPVTSQTTTTTTKKPTKDTLGEPPTGGGGAMGGGGGGGSEEAPAAAIAKKNYFWWYVGGAVLAYYVYSKYNKKK